MNHGLITMMEAAHTHKEVVIVLVTQQEVTVIAITIMMMNVVFVMALVKHVDVLEIVIILVVHIVME
jgi:hypothetical protein